MPSDHRLEVVGEPQRHLRELGQPGARLREALLGAIGGVCPARD